MTAATVQEYGWVPLRNLLADGLTAGESDIWQTRILHQASRLSRQLERRSRLFGLERRDEGMTLTVGGVVGSVQLAGCELRIAPKFVPKDRWEEPWEHAVLQMVGRATGRRWTTARSTRVAPGSARFFDHVARAFADAVHEAMRSDPVRTWQTFEEEHQVLRGRLLVARQLRSMLSRPGVIHCAVDRLHADNPVNHLLHWAAVRFEALVRDSATRRRVAAASAWLPRIRPPVRVPALELIRLPPQYAHWSEAVDLALLLARNLAQHPGGGADAGHALLVDSADLYEGFIERSLQLTVPGCGRGWRVEAQDQRTFAKPVEGTKKSYSTRPDDVVYKDDEPVLLIDAKYKKLGDADLMALKKPANADIYQLAASALAHGCSQGLLLYPKIVDDELADSKLRLWEVTLPGAEEKTIRLGAIAVDLMKLTDQSDFGAFDQHLLEQVGKMLPELLEDAAGQ